VSSMIPDLEATQKHFREFRNSRDKDFDTVVEKLVIDQYSNIPIILKMSIIGSQKL